MCWSPLLVLSWNWAALFTVHTHHVVRTVWSCVTRGNLLNPYTWLSVSSGVVAPSLSFQKNLSSSFGYFSCQGFSFLFHGEQWNSVLVLDVLVYRNTGLKNQGVTMQTTYHTGCDYLDSLLFAKFLYLKKIHFSVYGPRGERHRIRVKGGVAAHQSCWVGLKPSFEDTVCGRGHQCARISSRHLS